MSFSCQEMCIRDSSRRAVILDVGHFESEKPFVEEIKNLLENKKHRIEVVVAKEKPAWEYV